VVREHLPITLERLAELKARVDGGTPEDELLAVEGLDAATFERAKRGWLARMSEEAAQRSFRLAERYQAVYLAHRDDLRPIVERAAMARPEVAPVAEDIDGTAMGLNLDLGAALPFFGEADEPTSATDDDDEAPDSDALPEWKDPTNATQFVAALPDLDTLPFGAKPTPDAAPPTPFASHAPAVPAARALALPPPTPFASQLPAPHASRAPAPVAPLVSQAPMPTSRAPAPPAPAYASQVPTAPGPSATNVDATVMAGELRLEDLEAALPFDGQSVAPAPTASQAPLPPVARGDVDGTAFTSGPLPLDDVVPFAPPPAPVTLTEAQYASLCGDRQLAPQAQESVVRRYGLNDADQARALDAHWDARKQRDPQLTARLAQLTAQYVAWLRKSR
jgi:hypothetical protein